MCRGFQNAAWGCHIWDKMRDLIRDQPREIETGRWDAGIGVQLESSYQSLIAEHSRGGKILVSPGIVL